MILPGCVPVGLDTGTKGQLREGAGGLGPGNLMWAMALQSEAQWPWRGLWTSLGSAFSLWFG